MNEREGRDQHQSQQPQQKGSIEQYEEYLYGGGGQTNQNPRYGSGLSFRQQMAMDPFAYLDTEEDRLLDEELIRKLEAGEVGYHGNGYNPDLVPPDFRGDYIEEEEEEELDFGNSSHSTSSQVALTSLSERETNQQQTGLGDEEILASLPAFFPGIPNSVMSRFSARLGTRGLWRAFGQVVARRFGERAAIALGLSAGDGPLPIGEIISAGLAVATVWEIYQLWDELWAETEAELANPNSEIVVTEEPENQVYTTPNEEQRRIEHTGGVPPHVQTGTPPFDTETGREIVEGQQNTGGQTRQQPDARDFVMEWSPSMTPAEADEYTRDSYYAERTFYHGTDASSGRNISETGVDPAFFNELSNYGTGFYTARNQDNAREYAELTAQETGQQQALLGVKLKANNPVIFSSGVDFSVNAENYVRENGLTNVEPPDAYGKYLQSQGYDAIEIEALGYVVVFEPEQVVVIETEVIR